ncbi:hypothetical protein BAQU_1854 [Bifidobacterium aquikefiri]|uniref:Uncharacterized protein n=1 Tax=Bifidobacterium aquikefiri TaxID=1653207 RepID=A0A261G103_9BIFI|nr:hypothetical protein BAQU_1854 [Bifidobacterium aquikefiri]
MAGIDIGSFLLSWVLLRCMMVPQYGHRLLSCIPGQIGLSTSPNPSRKNASRHVSHTFMPCRYHGVKIIKQEQHPLPQGLGNDFPHAFVPITRNGNKKVTPIGVTFSIFVELPGIDYYPQNMSIS